MKECESEEWWRCTAFKQWGPILHLSIYWYLAKEFIDISTGYIRYLETGNNIVSSIHQIDNPLTISIFGSRSQNNKNGILTLPSHWNSIRSTRIRKSNFDAVSIELKSILLILLLLQASIRKELTIIWKAARGREFLKKRQDKAAAIHRMQTPTLSLPTPLRRILMLLRNKIHFSRCRSFASIGGADEVSSPRTRLDGDWSTITALWSGEGEYLGLVKFGRQLMMEMFD